MPNANPEDFFNYDLRERGWRQYCEKVSRKGEGRERGLDEVYGDFSIGRGAAGNTARR